MLRGLSDDGEEEEEEEEEEARRRGRSACREIPGAGASPCQSSEDTLGGGERDREGGAEGMLAVGREGRAAEGRKSNPKVGHRSLRWPERQTKEKKFMTEARKESAAMKASMLSGWKRARETKLCMWMSERDIERATREG